MILGHSQTKNWGSRQHPKKKTMLVIRKITMPWDNSTRMLKNYVLPDELHRVSRILIGEKSEDEDYRVGCQYTVGPIINPAVAKIGCCRCFGVVFWADTLWRYY